MIQPGPAGATGSADHGHLDPGRVGGVGVAVLAGLTNYKTKLSDLWRGFWRIKKISRAY